MDEDRQDEAMIRLFAARVLQLRSQGHTDEYIRAELLQALLAMEYTEESATEEIQRISDHMEANPLMAQEESRRSGLTIDPTEGSGRQTGSRHPQGDNLGPQGEPTTAQPTTLPPHSQGGPPEWWERRIAALEEELRRQSQNQTRVQEPVIRRARIADTAEFNGERRDYRRFKRGIAYKKSEDGDLVRDWTGYIMSRLTGRAATVGLAFLDRKPQASEAEFWAHLDMNFANHLAEEMARNRLFSMKQGNRKLRDFNLDFNNCAVEAGEEGVETLKAVYQRALREELRKYLITVVVERSWTLQDLQDRVVLIEENIFRSKLRSSPYTSEPKTTDEMEWEPTRAHSGRIPTNQGRGRGGGVGRRGGDQRPAPTNKNSPRIRARWVTEEVRKTRRANHECLRCGNGSHMVANCPQLPAERPSSAFTARPSPKQEEEDGGGGEEEGNETFSESGN